MSAIDPDQLRADSRDSWECAAAGWGKRADRVRDWGMPVSVAMVEGLGLGPGQRVLELAAGPGDTGFMAAELVAPGGTLLSSDGAAAMIDVARRRAGELGIDDVEFRQLELEWIDLPTASVDAVLCRWGIMLIVDPEAAAREVRRVLRAGGRAAFAVWDARSRNPWTTIPTDVLVALGHAQPPDPQAPGMFALAGEGRLTELLQDAGFTDVVVSAVSLVRRSATVQDYLDETAEMSPTFGATVRELDRQQRDEVAARIAAAVVPYSADDGSLVLPGSSLVAIASA
ncbi:MAG: methyltransferase domain-containing protein [Solirubrobacteraceae bacterium]